MNKHETHDHNNTSNNIWKSSVSEIGRNGTDPSRLILSSDVSDCVSVTETETESVTIPLADLETGLDLPATATCEVRVVTTGPASMVVEIERRGLTYIVEQSGASAELTGVYGADEDVGRPESVPDWLASVCEVLGIDEVTL